MGSTGLTDADRNLLHEFRRIITRDFGSTIQEILVFGSKARGDATEESDLDILVVIDAGDWRLKWRIADVAYELAIGTDVVPSVHVRTVAEWRHLDEIGAPFHEAVSQDAVAA